MEIEPTQYLTVLSSAYRKQYDEVSDEWTNDPQMRTFPALIQGMLKLPPTARALDVGCGSGRDAEYFGGIYASVTGLDIYRHAYWDEVTSRLPNVRFQCVDLLSYAGGETYDVILDNGCFHHQHPEHHVMYLRKVRSLLDPSGCFAISTFKNPSVSELIDQNGRLHLYFTDASLHELLGAAGFRVMSDFDTYRAKKRDYYRLTFCRPI